MHRYIELFKQLYFRKISTP